MAAPKTPGRRPIPHFQTSCYEFRQVRLGAVPVFSSFIKSFFSSLFLFLSSFREFSKRFPGFGKGDSRCSSCYPCTALKGWHHLTHTVTARKRAHPISKTGRCQPRLSNGRATFQNLSSSAGQSFHFSGSSKIRPPPFPNPNPRAGLFQCASAKDPRPFDARWRQSLFSSPRESPSRYPKHSTTF